MDPFDELTLEPKGNSQTHLTDDTVQSSNLTEAEQAEAVQLLNDLKQKFNNLLLNPKTPQTFKAAFKRSLSTCS